MKRCFLFLLVMLIAAAPALAETTYYGTMMVDNCEEWVSLRDGPGTGCGRLARVPLYAIVTDAEQGPFTGDFIYCNYDGQYGYILAKYLVPWADPEPEESGDMPIRADWAEATKNALVVDPDGEYVTIMADEPVTGFALLALELVDSETFFDATVLCERDGLIPDDPFVVKIAFPGDIPCYGIRFTDGDGRVRQFSIGISGRDGSLMLAEF